MNNKIKQYIIKKLGGYVDPPFLEEHKIITSFKMPITICSSIEERESNSYYTEEMIKEMLMKKICEKLLKEKNYEYEKIKEYDYSPYIKHNMKIYVLKDDYML